jgi:hypothetical protein
MIHTEEALKLALEAADEIEWMLKNGYDRGSEGPPRAHRLVSTLRALAQPASCPHGMVDTCCENPGNCNQSASRPTAEKSSAVHPAPTQKQVLGFEVVLDESLPPNTMKFVQPPTAQPVACFIGAKGSAFDLPETKRAYTYKEQPGNAVASKLGRACEAAIKQRAGDNIDRGLDLLQELQEAGFGVFALGAEYIAAQREPDAWMSASRFEELQKGFTVMTTLTKQKAFEDDVAIHATPPAQPAPVPLTENLFVRDLREYAKRFHSAHLFTGWDVQRALKHLDGYTTPPGQPAPVQPVQEPPARLLKFIGKDTYPEQGYTIARTYKELPKDSYPDVWEEGALLHTTPPAHGITKKGQP